MIVRESTLEETRNAIREGRLALMSPVMTSTDGRCVARMRWMPTARAIWARRAIDSSTSLLATIIRSASSSMARMTYGSGAGFPASWPSPPGAAPAPSSSSCRRTLRLYWPMLRTPSAASSL